MYYCFYVFNKLNKGQLLCNKKIYARENAFLSKKNLLLMEHGFVKWNFYLLFFMFLHYLR